jgi:hypothetical protein
VPSGIWDATEYAKLPGYDGEIADQVAAGAFAAFRCHSAPALLCAGWVGHRDPADLLAVRLGLARGDLDPAVLDYRTDVPLFPSGAQATAHGLRDIDTPGPATTAAVGKLLTAHPELHPRRRGRTR